MKIKHHKNFVKSYRKRILNNSALDKKFKERLKLFIEDKQNSLLKDHGLLGGKFGRRSFSVSGDIRVIYEEIGEVVVLHDIGTHNQVY